MKTLSTILGIALFLSMAIAYVYFLFWTGHPFLFSCLPILIGVLFEKIRPSFKTQLENNSQEKRIENIGELCDTKRDTKLTLKQKSSNQGLSVKSHSYNNLTSEKTHLSIAQTDLKLDRNRSNFIDSTKKDAGKNGVAVYVMRQGKKQQFKIGISQNPHKRLRIFKTGNPEITLVYHYWFSSRRNARVMEFNLHILLEAQGRMIKKQNQYSSEWFKLKASEIDLYITHMPAPLTNPDVLNYDEKFDGSTILRKISLKKYNQVRKYILFCYLYIMFRGIDEFYKFYDRTIIDNTTKDLKYNLYAHNRYKRLYYEMLKEESCWRNLSDSLENIF